MADFVKSASDPLDFATISKRQKNTMKMKA